MHRNLSSALDLKKLDLHFVPIRKTQLLLSTAEGKSGILVDVNSIFPGKLDCS